MVPSSNLVVQFSAGTLGADELSVPNDVVVGGEMTALHTTSKQCSQSIQGLLSWFVIWKLQVEEFLIITCDDKAMGYV